MSEPWSYWPTEEQQQQPQHHPPQEREPEAEPAPATRRRARRPSRRLVTTLCTALAMFVIAGAVAFWFVRSAPVRSFDAASSQFHADVAPVADELRDTLAEIEADGDGADVEALHDRACARAAALRDEYRDYRERLSDVQFPSRAAEESRQLMSAVNAGQLLMSVAASSHNAGDTVQVLTSWPSMTASIDAAEEDLRTAL